MSENLIPKINKTKYDENKKIISDNQLQLDQLRFGISGTLSAYESLFDENLQKKRYKKNDLVNKRAALHHTIRRLEREIAGITPRLAANIALLADYFPALDVSRLEEVEAFHQKIGSIVKKELKEELKAAIFEDVNATDEIENIDREIQSALQAKGMPDDVFNRVFALKEITDKAIEENKSFERKMELDEAIKISNERLDAIYTEIFSNIENKLNIKLKSFNRVVYGPSRASSELHIKSASSYRFTSEADTGTGKSYAGLIGFDLAMLSLTRLPLVIHDSIIYKNIEISAIRRILRILSSIRSKQIFISFDEAKKFGAQAEKLLSNFSVLKLTRDNLLYTSDWRNNNK